LSGARDCCKNSGMNRVTGFRKYHWLVQRLPAVLALALLAGVPSLARQSGGSGPGSSTPPPAQDKPAAQEQSPPEKSSGQPKSGKKSSDSPTTRLHINVSGKDKPIGNATVYVRFNTPGGFLRKDKLAELDFKTNQDGSVKVPAIPQGKILIQVIAKGWHTYGKWYDIQREEETIQIKLEPPPQWY
jgi:hypothetical protein